MSPALAPVPPDVLLTILEKAGFRVEKETEFNWTLFKEDSPCPIIILPKKGKLVEVPIMMEILDQIQMNNKSYLGYLNQISN